ncbi:unnamed protein product [Boreogadus saida]
MWPAQAERDLSFTVEPMETPTDADAPCARGVQGPPVTMTGMAGEPAAARIAVKLPKFSGATQPEPYLAQFRLAEWHNDWGAGEAVVRLALALEGTAVQALLDLAPADQRDLGALTRALERRFGQRAVGSHSRQLLNRRRGQEGERLETGVPTREEGCTATGPPLAGAKAAALAP